MTRKSMRDAMRYGVHHLCSINNDVQTESSYSRKTRNDLNRAIVMLRAAPDLIECLSSLVGFMEAGPMESYHQRTVNKANRALALANDPSRAGEIV